MQCEYSARVSEPACFGAAPALAPAPGIFYPEPAPAPAPGKREHNFGIFLKNNYQLSKIRSNTCTSTCRSLL